MPTDIDQPSLTYYVAPLLAQEGSGIQHCAYFFKNAKGWQRIQPPVPPVMLGQSGVTSSLVNIVQLNADNLPPGLPIDPKVIDPTAVLFAAVARTIGESLGLQNLFQASADRSIQIPVGIGSTRGLVLVFAVPGNAMSLRATTDPQIANSGIGTS